VAAPARGRGVATAALSLVAAWALGPVGLRVMTLQVLDGNTASMRVAERAGFHRVGKVEGDMGGVVQVAHLYARHARRR
jgi:RimJ/RimL family protein N-acetyltransferase